MKNKKMTPERKAEVLALIKNSFADIWSHPKGARGGKDVCDDQCEYCGKKVGGKTNTRFVQILTSGLIIPNSIEEAEVWELHYEGLCDQPQGGFAIGSECVKKVLGKEIDKYSEK